MPVSVLGSLESITDTSYTTPVSMLVSLESITDTSYITPVSMLVSLESITDTSYITSRMYQRCYDVWAFIESYLLIKH